jgi:hypothetical protein
MNLVIVIEAPNGQVFNLMVPINKTIKNTLMEVKKKYGRGYLICDWWSE